jgi:Domain of unknown function (DUF4470)
MPVYLFPDLRLSSALSPATWLENRSGTIKMLTSQFANLVTFFYPLGNTPAVSLTQNLPSKRQADVLLLGSGDVRHILFTVHTDRES